MNIYVSAKIAVGTVERLAGLNHFVSGSYIPKIRDISFECHPYFYCSNCEKIFDAKRYKLSHCNNCYEDTTLMRGPIYTTIEIDKDKFFAENLGNYPIAFTNKNTRANGRLELSIGINQSYFASVRGLRNGRYTGFVLPSVSAAGRYEKPIIVGKLLTPLQAYVYARTSEEIDNVIERKLKAAAKSSDKPKSFRKMLFQDFNRENLDYTEIYNKWDIMTSREFLANKAAYIYSSIHN